MQLSSVRKMSSW